MLAADGSLDRSKLGAAVFNNAELRRQLEGIIHPLVQAEARRIIAAQPADAMVIYNVPLLVEANVQLAFDVVVTVEAPVDVRVERLMNERGMSKSDAVARVQSQASATERANHADHILNSNQDLALLLKDARLLWNRFTEEAKRGTN
jgi:dephospho-CoA kinase